MQTSHAQILAWARKAFRFASEVDAKTFADNGVLLMAPTERDQRGTYKILVKDKEGGVQWVGIRSDTGTFTMADVGAWVTGTVREKGIAATFTALSSPPKMIRTGKDVAGVASIKYFMQPATRTPFVPTQWLNHTTPEPGNPEVLRTMKYEDYLQTPHWHRVKADALARALNRCAVCNTSANVHVHHRTYERLGRELPSDVTVLCDDCHATFHARLPRPPQP